MNALEAYRRARYWLTIFVASNLITWFVIGDRDAFSWFALMLVAYHLGRGTAFVGEAERARDGRSL